mgnify:CR=1 FL=1
MQNPQPDGFAYFKGVTGGFGSSNKTLENVKIDYLDKAAPIVTSISDNFNTLVTNNSNYKTTYFKL